MKIPLSVTPTRAGPRPTDASSSVILFNDETLIVELQGTLELSKPGGNGLMIGHDCSKDGLDIGRLDLTNPERPQLVIGNYQLEGKVVKLAKPLTVVRKTEWKSKLETSLEPSRGAQSYPSQLHQSLDIVALVERKLVFTKRPQPIVHANHNS